MQNVGDLKPESAPTYLEMLQKYGLLRRRQI